MGVKIKKGFTLIEVLISTVLVFMVLSLIYMTFFSISNVTVSLENKLYGADVMFNFLKGFHNEISTGIYGDDTVMTDKEIVFLYKDKYRRYPVKARYFVQETEKGRTLFREQENILSGYRFVFPVFKDFNNIEFNFHDGESWDYQVESAEEILKVALILDSQDKYIFYPVSLPQKTDEK